MWITRAIKCSCDLAFYLVCQELDYTCQELITWVCQDWASLMITLAKSLITWVCQELDCACQELSHMSYSIRARKSSCDHPLFQFSCTLVSNMNASNSSSAAEFFTCTLQVVYLSSSIICILGVMLFFKMYRKLIYCLLFYALTTVILSEISGAYSQLSTSKVIM